jgi:Na+/melibiose symporter-like transporter
VSLARLGRRIARLHPFTTRYASNLAILFGVVYFAQGMWHLPRQSLVIAFKDGGLSAVQVAMFFSLSRIPWLIKPVYGLLSDSVPLFGRRRKSYFVLAAFLSAGAGAALALTPDPSYWRLAALFVLMAMGLAFSDVLTDALMVEQGRPRGLTGAFQAVQWACIYGATVLVGVAGGRLAETRSLRTAFAVAAVFPLIAATMTVWCVREPRRLADRAAVAETWAGLHAALRDRQLWIVAGFIFFWTFSPSLGTALFYYQTDTLKFSQQFIGRLTAFGSSGAIAGAVMYAPLSRSLPLRRIINLAIGMGVLGTLAFLAYRGPWSAIIIDVGFGCAGMVVFLAFLDLAAKACPRGVEGTFFALLAAVYNGGSQGSEIVGGYLYGVLGYVPLILISAAASALAWVLVPLVRIDAIEATARREVDAVNGNGTPGTVPGPLS